MSKKGLALTLAALMVWAFAVPAFSQAEPFPDVPQDHWAYEAVESLRQAGLIEGYPDGTFGGERTFTRYEMAMVFSRILERLMAWLEGREALLISAATGEVIAALAEEFAPELAEQGIDSADLGQILGAMNARIQSLTAQVESLVEIANAAQAEAEAAASVAAGAEERAYRARLAAESARANASEAAQVADRALAIAAMSVGLDEAEVSVMSAQEAAEAALAAAAQASGVAEGVAAEDARRAVAEAEAASERAYRARLAAQQARSLAEEAKEIAERGVAIAEMAYYSEETKQALEAADQAADRAYRARLAAEDARAQAREAREVAERALAIAEMAGPGALDEARAAMEAVGEAREVALRAQRMAAEAESAAMMADSKADLAREEAAESLAVAQEAYQLASDAMNEAFRQGEMARAEAREALEAAQAADRLAFLALFTAEQALVRLDEVEPQVEELRARPVLGGEFRTDFEETHTSNPSDGVPSDPRNLRSSKIKDATVFEASVALNATVEPAEDVVVTGGVKLASDVFGVSTDAITLADLFLKVTTPGVIRSAYFGSGVSADEAAQGFSKYVLHADGYGDPRGGAVVDTQVGNLTTRFIATRASDGRDPRDVYGIASTLPLADGMTVGFNYTYTDAEHRATALQLSGETGGLAYDWTYALFRDETAIDGSLTTALGSLELGFDYYSVGALFGDGDEGSLGKELTYDDDGIVAGRTAYTLRAGLPFAFGKAVYEKGYDALLADRENDFTDYRLAGLEDVDVLGFEMAGYFYADERDHDRKSQAYRFDVSRTLELVLPLSLSFTQANISQENWAAADVPFDEREYRSIGVSVDDYALTETVTLNAGYKTETNPLGGDWKAADEWVLELTDDADAEFSVDKQATLSGSVSLAATEALTLKAGYEQVRYEADADKFARSTVDLGADYTMTMYGADVTLGYAYQTRTFTAPFEYDASPRSTYSVSVTRALFGGTVDASYKLITGRGADSKAKTEARDVVASLDYTYPFSEDFELTLSGKWGSSVDNNKGAYVDDDYEDGYYASVKAGLGLKF